MPLPIHLCCRSMKYADSAALAEISKSDLSKNYDIPKNGFLTQGKYFAILSILNVLLRISVILAENPALLKSFYL